MKIGVKYCGGCNVKYDRKHFIESIKKQFPFNYCNAKPNIEYDILLVLCGCFSCCADYKQLKYKYKRVVVKEESDYMEVVNAFEELSNNRKD